MISLENITFVITTFRSNRTIFNCLDSIPNKINKIIIENSQDENLKIALEHKYENLECFVMPENLGYGKANNFGIKKTKTDYVFILNPDTILAPNFFDNFLYKLKSEEFSIAAPLEENDGFDYLFKDNQIADVEHVKGFAMLLNKKNLFQTFFDENFFLYLEEIDLCRNIKAHNGRIIIVNIKIKHEGGNSHGNRDDLEMEKSRNWHWMWSKFYYKKKYNGYMIGMVVTFPNFLSSLIKYLFYSFTKNSKKKMIYKMRFLGLLNSYLLKKSYYRPNIDKIK